jgi:hypothetical protein
MVQTEPWLERDKVMIDMLKSIGIEKGKPFNPDAKTQETLETAAREAQAWLNARYETVFPPYYEGEQWAIPATPEFQKTVPTFYETPDAYSVDARGLTDYWAFSTVKHLGAGQFYLMSIRDKTGRRSTEARHIASRCLQTLRPNSTGQQCPRPRHSRPHP